MGVGLPDAAAVNVPELPLSTIWLVGWVVIAGAASLGGEVVTVSVAALVVAGLPTPLLNTARYS